MSTQLLWNTVKADVGMAVPPSSHMHALRNWVAEQPTHAYALNALAWYVQHTPAWPKWRQATGPVMFTVLRTSDFATLRVKLAPLALMRIVDSSGHNSLPHCPIWQ